MFEKDGVFTTAEKNAIAASTVDTHTLTTDNVTYWTKNNFVKYVALNGEQIFLLDAEDVSNGAYGYSMTNVTTENRKKIGNSAASWWLRSASRSSGYSAGFVDDDYNISFISVYDNDPGVSPALNLNLSSVIFSSASAQSDSGESLDKSSALTSESTEIGTVANTEWKLTLKDDKKSVAFTEGRSVTKASNGTITVPYTYTDKEEATDSEKVNQISVMITDEAYGSESAQILYYGALQDIKNEEGNTSTVAKAFTGTGTFALPSGLTGTLGTDYHIYLLAEHVNADNSTDYASEPVEVTAIKIDSVTVTGLEIDTPTPEQPLQTEIDITTDSTSVSSTATLTWKKEETVATGNAQWKTTYQAYVTLTAKDGYTFIDATGVIANGTLNGSAVDSNKITLNNDGTQMTIDCGAYTTATRKTTGAEAPEAPTQFANYYTADDVLSSTELGKAAKVTLEGTTQPNPEEMEVEWAIVDAEGNATTYNATPEITNIFKWTVKASGYADYDKGAAVLEGTVAIKNKDYTPVTISGSDVTVSYGGTLDVSQYFTIDENAGTPTYELSDTSTGTGTLDGATFTMTTLGTFVVKVSTSINGVYNKGEHTLTITVNKATPYIKTKPTAAAITYGQTLGDSALSGGAVQYSESDEKTVAGTFAWREAAAKPTVADSGKTEYVVVFTPKDADHYNTVETGLTLTVNKAEAAPNKPESTMNTVYTNDTVGKVTLPEGWVWQETDKDKALTVGTPVIATAIYTGEDAGNYVIEIVEISITRLACTHATTEIRDAVAATCTVKGYTGDTYCKVCGEKVKTGQDIDALGHDFSAEFTVDVAPTCAMEGSKSRHCTRCDETTDVTVIEKLTTHTYVNGVCSVCDKIFETTVDGITYKVVTETGENGKPVGKLVTVSENDIPQLAVAVTGTSGDFSENISEGKVAVPSEIMVSGSEQTFVVTKISDNAFSGVSVTEIVVPATVSEVGTGALGGAATITFKGTTAPSGIAGAITGTGVTINVPEGAGDSYREAVGETINIAEEHTHVKDNGTRVEPTCEEKGSITYKCTKCGEVMEVAELEAFGHSYTNKVTKAATITSTGIMTYTCTRCGDQYTEVIPKLPIVAPSKGKKLTDTTSKAVFTVTKAGKVTTSAGTGKVTVTSGEVAYTKSTNAGATTLTIPSTVKINGITYKVTSIGANAFANNKKLTKVTMGSYVKTIGSKAFYKCTALKAITIPATVSKIGKQAFYGCKNLKTVTIKTTKLSGSKVGSKAFTGIYSKATVKVPKSKYEAYKKLLKVKGLGAKAVIKK